MITYEHQVIAPDGTMRWQQWTDRALADETGTVKEYQSIGIDTTRRRLMAMKLQESEARTQALLDASPEVAFLMDTRGNLLSCNKAFCLSFGETAEELLGKKAWATRGMDSQSIIHLLIIVFIIMGNVAYFVSRSAQTTGARS